MLSAAAASVFMCVHVVRGGGRGAKHHWYEPPYLLTSCLPDPQDIAIHRQTANTRGAFQPSTLALLSCCPKMCFDVNRIQRRDTET